MFAFTFSLLLLVVCFTASQAFSTLPSTRLVRKSSLNLDINTISDLLLAGGSTTDDGIVYGSVQAPSFVPFVGAFFVIILAGLPALLSSGEKALEQQRLDEESKGNQFGSGDSVSKRNRDV